MSCMSWILVQSVLPPVLGNKDVDDSPDFPVEVADKVKEI